MPARHFDVLNKMLANACPREIDGVDSLFEFDLHCANAKIWAKLVEPGKGHEFRYEIVSFEIVED